MGRSERRRARPDSHSASLMTALAVGREARWEVIMDPSPVGADVWIDADGEEHPVWTQHASTLAEKSVEAHYSPRGQRRGESEPMTCAAAYLEYRRRLGRLKKAYQCVGDVSVVVSLLAFVVVGGDQVIVDSQHVRLVVTKAAPTRLPSR